MLKNYPTIPDLDALFEYSPEDGSLVRRRPPREHYDSIEGWRVACALFNGAKVKSGNPAADGSLRVTVSRRAYPSVKIAWAIQTRRWPDHEVDVADGDPCNLRWSNLRPVAGRQELRSLRRLRDAEDLLSRGLSENGAYIYEYRRGFLVEIPLSPDGQRWHRNYHRSFHGAEEDRDQALAVLASLDLGPAEILGVIPDRSLATLLHRQRYAPGLNYCP